MFEEMKIRYLFALSVAAVLVLVVFAVGIGVSEEFFGAAANIVIYAIIPAIFFGHYFNRYPNIVRDVIIFKGINSWLPAIIGIVVVSIALSLSSFWLLVFVIDPIFPSFVDFLMTEVPMPSTPILLVTEIIAITILGPIVEEFVFRGVFLHRFMKKTSMWGGILISSILFGILHADMIGAFLFGVIACLLYLRTGNLLLPILMHILNNTLAVIASYLPASWFNGVVITTREDIVNNSGTLSVLLVISSILTAYIIVKLARGLAKKREEAARALETISE
ncbi:CPBP family intramembrane glutamic endopeptidase [Sporosarcina highlanderae]|uniref:CPBP family intramembrane metalloprotease n=1 Tax=Sporosarcina highlanderae TaxID=3035916 RepID=A0ABT8JVL9_9BACL|nr:CPBP family intramembrane glutamic endopeptidase [Sporosarcina highlanderae]MDN4609221.1 CPBP family intramembrane metalloprotease [Sporosarcina highlanderae]